MYIVTGSWCALRHINFIAFDGARKFYRRFICNNPVSERRGHLVDLGFVRFQLVGNLPVGKVAIDENIRKNLLEIAENVHFTPMKTLRSLGFNE